MIIDKKTCLAAHFKGTRSRGEIMHTKFFFNKILQLYAIVQHCTATDKKQYEPVARCKESTSSSGYNYHK